MTAFEALGWNAPPLPPRKRESIPGFVNADRLAVNLARLQGEMTRAELARAMGLTERQVQHLQEGTCYNPRFEMVERLAGALGCEAEELVREVRT